ncbi:flagellar hook protein FlgE [Myxococcota bacterium]|nr:flagellar hook protein FlgE [Myxococcota bacterium]
MSIWTSLLTGSSGLNAFQQAIGTVGDNISNVSTTGFRASRASFEDVLGGTAGNGQRLGAGVKMTGPQTLLGQGTLQQTSRALDLAVRGQGLFVLQGSHDGIGGTYYSRDGRFNLDKNGYLTNPEGLRVQGYSITDGVTSPLIDDIHLDPQGPPQPTSLVDVAVNLDPTQTNPPPVTTVRVYDSLGGAHEVNLTFTADPATPNGWLWSATVDGAEVTGGTPGTPQEIAQGTITFTTDGALDLVTQTAGFAADFLNATPGQVITFDFGDAIADGGTGTSGSTQYQSGFNVKSVTQDGYAPGTLTDVQVSDDGVMTAVYSNGHSEQAARIALASFGAEGELKRAGGQLFVETADSGEARLGAAATGQRGAIAGETLEGSNVDLGNELITLIAYQRAFQANSRVVTTADEVLNELSQIKR